MLDWDVSEGNIVINEEQLDDYPHFAATIQHYSPIIQKMKTDFPEMFEDKRKYTIENINDRPYKIFETQERMSDRQIATHDMVPSIE